MKFQKPILSVDRHGDINFNKTCPFQPNFQLCGDWCALFQVQEPSSITSEIRVELKCAHTNLAFVYLEDEIQKKD